MYWEAYEKTYYQNFIDEDMKQRIKPELLIRAILTVMIFCPICALIFYKNIYVIIKDCDDCENKDAFS